ncbi:aminoacyl-tRNA hydrolase [Gallionella capsiferriformans]|jgi:PTH1 family peptidyl-tRNA hydrolase|uniref:Peptidyl-tRNA hydrolase n=1 Tax=Gallionella capsiferriformans (strain ES-2) TaxID=395494 RepID=D9SC58_GALCS|nr:aminoacyl-tRNA hydrolase [Gallionella capsiferriformans]ADL54523.1 peptidyl-tRNA hydrolase [Gallionella capsiferriformans ES-2]
MDPIRLIVGLGNPGREYEATRHNVGFWWVDELAEEAELNFKSEAKFHGLSARGLVLGRELILLKPQTFMNLSGRSVGALAQFYKIAPAQILVVHDELDLQPGIARLKLGGSHGGHNGLKDIIAQLGGREFWRLRLGIGHPGDRAQVSDFVLGHPREAERELMLEAQHQSMQVLPSVLDGKMEAAMLKLHSRK